MKKTYSKPQIAFDSFEISSSIADGCGMSGEAVQDECGVTVAGIGSVFHEENAGCLFKVEQDDGEWGVCYYVPMGDNTVFGS